MDICYDEQLIVSAGMNIKLSKSVHFIDLLRVEMYQDIRKELGLMYLTEITKNTKYRVFDQEPEILPENCIVLFSNWSVLIKSTKFHQLIIISPLYTTCTRNSPVCYLTLNHTKCISFKILGTVELFMNVTNVPNFILTFWKINLQELKEKTANRLREMIIHQSKVPPRPLLKNLEEARDILKSNSSSKSMFIASKPTIDLLVITAKPECRKIETKLYEINEKSESLEYSPTQEISEMHRNHFPRRNIITKRTDTLNKSLEEVTRKQQITECNPFSLILDTPPHSPKQCNYSIIEIKNMIYLGKESTQDVSEKPTIFTEQTNILQNKPICACIACVIF